MVGHQPPRLVGVVRADGVENGLVLADGVGNAIPRDRQRDARQLFKDLFQNAEHLLVVGRAGDGQMELFVPEGDLRNLVDGNVAVILADALQLGNVRVGPALRGIEGRRAFQRLTHLQQLQNLGGADARNDKAAVRQRFDIAVVDQPAERLLDRCAADLDLLTDLPDGQGIAGRIVAVHDLFQQSIIHIFRLARCFGKNLQSTHLKLPQS